MTIDEQIAVLQAVKDGKKIEAQLIERPDSGWHEWFGTVDFCNYAYRIVREPRRFIIFKWLNGLHVVPYGAHVPDGAKIICTAVEEENLSVEQVAAMAKEQAAEIIKSLGTPPA